VNEKRWLLMKNRVCGQKRRSTLSRPNALNAAGTFESIFRYIRAEIAGMVYGTASDPGDVEKHPALMEQAHQLGLKFGKCRSQVDRHLGSGIRIDNIWINDIIRHRVLKQRCDRT